MKKIRLWQMMVAAVVFGILCVYGFQKKTAAGDRKIISYYIADIDMDGEEELLTIHAAVPGQVTDQGRMFGNTLQISKEYKVNERSGKVLSEKPEHSFDLSYVKPLQVQAGDINGDGKQEISIMAYKETQFHKVLAKRPFFYALTDGKLESIWLGSRLSRPFTDFMLYDIDSDGIAEIISIENDREGRFVACAYDWEGFGFDLSSETEATSQELTLEQNRHKAADHLYIYENGKQVDLVQQGENIIKVTVQDGEKNSKKPASSLLVRQIFYCFSHRMDIRCFLTGFLVKKMHRPE